MLSCITIIDDDCHVGISTGGRGNNVMVIPDENIERKTMENEKIIMTIQHFVCTIGKR